MKRGFTNSSPGGRLSEAKSAGGLKGEGELSKM
jgi:hypothetical protein